MDLGKAELPQVPRSGKCNCGGELVERQNPKPGVRSAVLCESCGKWLRWELDPGRSHPTQADLDRGEELAQEYGWE